MSVNWDDFTPVNPPPNNSVNWDNFTPVDTPKRRRQEDEPAPGRTVGDVLKDAGVTALKGAVGLPQAVVGLADIVTLGRVGKKLEELGYRPEEAKQILDSWYSPAQQEANRKVREAEGFFGTLDAAIENPSVIATTVGESIPQMLGGAAVARGLIGATAGKVAPWAAGGIGEGVMGAGAAASEIRSQTEDGTLTPQQAGAALASGAGTAVLGAVGGKVAQRMGVPDVDTMLAQGGGKLAKSPAGFVKAVVGAGISEGVFEELPQYVQEQLWLIWALGKPVTDGVGNAAALGLLSGVVMGGAGGGYNAVMAPKSQPEVTQRDPLAPEAEPDAAPPAAAPAATTGAAPSATPADPTTRLAELEILSEQRDLTPVEQKEAADLLTAMSDEQADVPLTDEGKTPAADATLMNEGGTPAAEVVPEPVVGPQGGTAQELSPASVALQAAQIRRREAPGTADPRIDTVAAQEAYLQGIARENPEQARALAAAFRANPEQFGEAAGVSPEMVGRYASIIERRLALSTQPAQPEPVSQPAQPGTTGEGAGVSRPAQVASDFWSFAKSKGFTPGQIKVGTPEHAALKAEYDALKAGKAEPILPPLQPQPSVDLQNRDRSRAASVVQMSDI
ncbi:MAG: hypothetical protein RLZZ129_1745, partial [Verrucomicrobiota bacterium]